MATGQKDDLPSSLDTPAKRALFSNLGEDEALALRVDAAVKANLMDDWLGDPAKESYILNALYDILQDETETWRIFHIVSAQQDYL
ncbi:hypothetical protein [Endozoicomonas atrinae]|uniref:hypothetical protein n=1 Tax=Endozoicomonas atrinae TaxID=1333660 RepID=UPI003AFFAA5F